MCVEIVHDYPDDLSLGIIAIGQHLHTVREVVFGAPGGHFDMPPAVTWLKEHEQIAGAIAPIVVVVPLRHAWLRGLRLAHFSTS